MGYLADNKITVFPAASHGANHPDARLTTEFNISNIINQLIDKNGFVISLTNTDIEFNIRGYYFKAAISDIISAAGSPSSGSIYAQININASYNELEGDADNQFKGLIITTEVPSNNYLEILKWDNTLSTPA